MDVMLTCETKIIDPPSNKESIDRSNIICKITYVAQSKRRMI
jgi:hypothetical protein